jgi:putative PIN family toxin of toxin-antitoxin system
VKVVLDTNIWVSSLIASSRTAAAIVDEWRAGRFSVIISEQQLFEIYDVFTRPKFLAGYQIRKQEIEDLALLISRRAERITLRGSVKLCRDPDDNVIIESAVRGKATYLITGDKDIVEDDKVRSYLFQHSVSLIAPSEFLSVIAKV